MKDIIIQGDLKSSLVSPFDAKQQNEVRDNSFMETLKSTIDEVNKLNQEADQAVKELATGNEGDIHNTMIALEKAEVSFQLMMQVRNKIVAAYETIMRTNI